uniref:HDC11023 n=1 Tax=Drosophila melanogaster TaxID=7227 RepID=Q6IKY7_DROME|nr:TPA_inf: HDC11023 [Drosophila melanogaster]
MPAGRLMLLVSVGSRLLWLVPSCNVWHFHLNGCPQRRTQQAVRYLFLCTPGSSSSRSLHLSADLVSEPSFLLPCELISLCPWSGGNASPKWPHFDIFLRPQGSRIDGWRMEIGLQCVDIFICRLAALVPAPADGIPAPSVGFHCHFCGNEFGTPSTSPLEAADDAFCASTASDWIMHHDHGLPGSWCLVPGSGCGDDCPLRAWILAGFRCRSLSRLAFWHFRSSPPPPSPPPLCRAYGYRHILRHVRESHPAKRFPNAFRSPHTCLQIPQISVIRFLCLRFICSIR